MKPKLSQRALKLKRRAMRLNSSDVKQTSLKTRVILRINSLEHLDLKVGCLKPSK